jgi:hypothetical protein
MILFHPLCHRVNVALVTRTFREQLVTTVAATAITDNQPISPKLPAPNTFHSRSHFFGKPRCFCAIYFCDGAIQRNKRCLKRQLTNRNHALHKSTNRGLNESTARLFGAINEKTPPTMKCAAPSPRQDLCWPGLPAPRGW